MQWGKRRRRLGRLLRLHLLNLIRKAQRTSPKPKNQQRSKRRNWTSQTHRPSVSFSILTSRLPNERSTKKKHLDRNHTRESNPVVHRMKLSWYVLGQIQSNLQRNQKSHQMKQLKSQKMTISRLTPLNLITVRSSLTQLKKRSKQNRIRHMRLIWKLIRRGRGSNCWSSLRHKIWSPKQSTCKKSPSRLVRLFPL